MFKYKILNKLFGWDYIQWRNFADAGIARVRSDPMGRAWYWRYKTIRVADEISKPEQVLWLTCEPSKYMRRTNSKSADDTLAARGEACARARR